MDTEIIKRLTELLIEASRKHLIIYYKGNRSLMPRHPAKEVKTGTVQGILKKLEIEEL